MVSENEPFVISHVFRRMLIPLCAKCAPKNQLRSLDTCIPEIEVRCILFPINVRIISTAHNCSLTGMTFNGFLVLASGEIAHFL